MLFKTQGIFCIFGFDLLMILSAVCTSFPRSSQLGGCIVPLSMLNQLFCLLKDILVSTALLKGQLLRFGGRSSCISPQVPQWRQLTSEPPTGAKSASLTSDTPSLDPRPRPCGKRDISNVYRQRRVYVYTTATKRHFRVNYE